MLRRAIQAAGHWGEMIKFSHSVFALPFAIVATVLAGRRATPPGPGWFEVGLIVLCMVTARSFAMTINRIVDARFDGRNTRTANRPLVTGAISHSAAWSFAVATAILFVAACYGFQAFRANAWPVVLSPIVLAYLAGYSFAKRFTVAAHFWLGFAIASAPAAAWIAVHPPSVGLPALLLVLASGLWIAGFDLIYACQDIDADRRERLHSIPARYGAAAALRLSRACHVATVAALSTLPAYEPMGGLYWAGVALAAGLLAYEQSLVRADDLSRVNLAFFTVNGCVSIGFAGLAVADVLLAGRAA